MASLVDAEEALRSTSSKANFQRLTRLLMCGGVRLLRETFDSIHSPADLPVKLSDPAIQAQLRGARLTRPQWDCLYPSPGVYGKSTNFDITLIFRLLRTICNLTPPPGPRGWDDLPNSSDHSLEADLVRIKYYRNEVFGHSNTLEISDVEFDDLWRNISEPLIRIAAGISHAKRDEWKKSIDDFFDNPLTPEEERYIEELDKWYKQDMDIKNEVEKLGDTIKEEFKALKEDMKGRRQVSIQEEVQSFRQEIREMQQIHRPVNINTGPVVVQQTIHVTIVEGTTQAGLPFRPQSSEEAGSQSNPVSHPDQELEAGAEGSSAEPQLNQPNPPTEIAILDVLVSFKQSFNLFLQYFKHKLNSSVRGHKVGSLLITVECSSLQILEGLWEDYRSGHLTEIAQEMLVTAEVLEKLSLVKVKVKTFISEKEYEEGKQFFMDNSAIKKSQKQKAADTRRSPVDVKYHEKTEGVLINLHITVAKYTRHISSTNQLEQRAGSQDMCIVPMPLEEEQKRCIWSAIMSVEESVESFLGYLRDRLHLIIGNYRIGSLFITVECRSLQILEGLWEDYWSGHLNEVAQEMLVTAGVLKKLNFSEMKLKTFINEEEYQSCQKYFPCTSAQSEVGRTREVSEGAQSQGIISPSISGKHVPSTSKKDEGREDYSSDHPRIKFKELYEKQSLLERISKLEKENNDLRSRVEALERAMQLIVDSGKEKESSPLKRGIEGSEMLMLQEESSELKKGVDSDEQTSHDQSLETKRRRVSEQSATDKGKQRDAMAEIKGSVQTPPAGLGEVELKR